MTRTDPLAGAAAHGIWTLIATLIPGAYGIVVASYLLHTLPSDLYALWATGLAMVGWLTLLDAGLASTIVRDAARALAGETVARIRVQVANSVYQGLAVIALLIGGAASLLLPRVIGAEGPSIQVGMAVAALLACDFAIVLATAAWTGLLRGARRFDLLAAVSVVQVAVAVPLFLLLLPPLGIIGAAAAQIIGRLAARVVLAGFVRSRVPWFDLRPRTSSRSDIANLISFTLPIVGIQVATQLGMGTDVFVVGAAWGATAVGMYAAGSQLIRYVGQFLFPAVNVVLPAFASADHLDRRHAPELLLRTLLPITAIGVAVFLGIAANADAVMTLWAGEASGLATSVLVAHALVFTVIAPAHLMTLMLIARGQHRVVGGVVLVESILNLGLSIILVNVIGPVGPAISTLIVVGLDDLIVIPILASARLHVSAVTLWLRVAGGFGVGGAIVGLSLLLPDGGGPVLAIRILIEAVILSTFLWFWFGRRAARIQ